MWRTGIWFPACRNTEFNSWTCGFWSRARICGQAHVYPAWSKVPALLTPTCWQGARSVWFAVTGQEDDLLMMFLKCKRAQCGASHFPRLAPRRHQSLFRPLPLGDITDQKFRESWHESGSATLVGKKATNWAPTNIDDYCVGWIFGQTKSFGKFLKSLSEETSLCHAANLCAPLQWRVCQVMRTW